MTECQKSQELLIRTLCNELSPEEKPFFEAHLETCPRCAAEYKEMSSTLRIMEKRQRPDPGQSFWDGYWDKLSQRLEREKPRQPEPLPWWKKLFRPFEVAPKWAYQVAAALTLVVIGIIVGRSLLSPPAPALRQAQQRPAISSPGQQPDPVLQAQNYFERSKLILLALVNYDPNTQDPYGLDLPRQKQVSRELVNEAGYLKAELKDPSQRRLRELVSDLETILIQIANLESENDLAAVEFVKQGVESRGVLLKINLSEMGGGVQKGKKDEPASKAQSHKSSV